MTEFSQLTKVKIAEPQSTDSKKQMLHFWRFPQETSSVQKSQGITL